MRLVDADVLMEWLNDQVDWEPHSIVDFVNIVRGMPSVELEPLVGLEEDIFLCAMAKEEKVCRKVDEEMAGQRHPDLPDGKGLLYVCSEIRRKVKKAKLIGGQGYDD